MKCLKHGYSGARPPKQDCRNCRMVYVEKHYQEKSSATLGRELGIRPQTARMYASEMGLKKRRVVATKETVKKDTEQQRLREDRNATNRKYNILMRENVSLQTELSALLDLKSSTSEVHVIKPFDGDVSESTAVVLLSDFHVEEKVKLSETSGLNRYSLAIAEQRADDLFKVLVRLIGIEQQNTPIPRLVMWLGGDFITGNIHDEFLESCAVPPVEAAVIATGFLQSGIDHVLEHTLVDLVIPCSVGNHSRIGKPHYSNELGNSLELFLYRQLERLYEDNSRVKFIIEDAYHTYVKVYDVMLRFHHGHSVRYAGGVGGLTIPLNKAIAQWNRARTADIDCMGHWHTFFDQGNAIVNGSLIGYNAFALRNKFSYERPAQAFFVINQRLNAKIVMRPLLV